MGHRNPGMLSKEGHQQAMALGERQHATFSKAAAPSHGDTACGSTVSPVAATLGTPQRSDAEF